MSPSFWHARQKLSQSSSVEGVDLDQCIMFGARTSLDNESVQCPLPHSSLVEHMSGHLLPLCLCQIWTSPSAHPTDGSHTVRPLSWRPFLGECVIYSGPQCGTSVAAYALLSSTLTSAVTGNVEGPRPPL